MKRSFATSLGLWLTIFALVQVSPSVARAQESTDVTKIIAPFVEKHCVQCQGEKKPKGNVSLHVFKDETSIIKARKTWFRVIEQSHW